MRFKGAWKELVVLNMESLKWLKNHWLWYLLVCITLFGAGCGIGYIREKLVERKEDEECSQSE